MLNHHPLKLVSVTSAPLSDAERGRRLAQRAFLDRAARALVDALEGCAAADSPFATARAALGEEEFQRLARESVARHAARVLEDPTIVEVAEQVASVEADAAVIDVIAEVLQDVGRAAWAKAARK